jgi:hypothetical protein
MRRKVLNLIAFVVSAIVRVAVGKKETGRRMVYIAGPISKGDLAGNINRANEAFRTLAKAGFAPLCPQWSCFSGGAQQTATGGSVFAFATATGNGMSHAEWLAVDLEFVRRADAVLRIPGESTGADMETAEAQRLGIPVFNSVDEIIQWAQLVA